MFNKKSNLLKIDNNRRGLIAEELVRFEIPSSLRCKNNDVNKLNLESLNEERINFLKNNWRYFDLIKIKRDELILFEVKSRKYTLDRKIWKKHAVFPFIHEMYEKAIRLGIKVFLVELKFIKNWEYLISVKRYNKHDFSISKNRSQSSRRVKKSSPARI